MKLSKKNVQVVEALRGAALVREKAVERCDSRLVRQLLASAAFAFRRAAKAIEGDLCMLRCEARFPADGDVANLVHVAECDDSARVLEALNLNADPIDDPPVIGYETPNGVVRK